MNGLESFNIYYETGELKFNGKNVVDWKIEQLNFFNEKGEKKRIRTIGLGELLSNEGLIEYL